MFGLVEIMIERGGKIEREPGLEQLRSCVLRLKCASGRSRTLEAGHTGIIFLSIANPGGANVVIFSERLEGENRIEVNDPEGRLPRNRSSWER